MLDSRLMPDGAASRGGRTGLLLINLGTPNSPRPEDVRPYLDEFLSDPRVLDMPAWRRWLVLHLLILPFRPKASGEAYAKIWTERGSPLLFHSQDLAQKVQQRLGAHVSVDLAMRYGRPSIPEALARFRRAGIDRIVVVPALPAVQLRGHRLVDRKGVPARGGGVEHTVSPRGAAVLRSPALPRRVRPCGAHRCSTGPIPSE